MLFRMLSVPIPTHHSNPKQEHSIKKNKDTIITFSPMTSKDPEAGSNVRASSRHRRHSVLDYVEKHLPQETEAIKEHGLPFKMGDPIHSEDAILGTLRNTVGRIVNSPLIQIFVTCVIVGNALLLAVITVDAVRFNAPLLNSFEWVDNSMLIIFTVEFVCQFFYLGPKFIRNSWLIFDALVVIFSWAFLGSPVKVFRAFRIFRLFSLASKWKAMQRLFTSLANTVPKLATVAGLLALFFYATTVFCTVLCKCVSEHYLCLCNLSRTLISLVFLLIKLSHLSCCSRTAL